MALDVRGPTTFARFFGAGTLAAAVDVGVGVVGTRPTAESLLTRASRCSFRARMSLAISTRSSKDNELRSRDRLMLFLAMPKAYQSASIKHNGMMFGSRSWMSSIRRDSLNQLVERPSKPISTRKPRNPPWRSQELWETKRQGRWKGRWKP